MSGPVVEILGVAVRHPVTVATNLLLTAQAVWIYRRLGRPDVPLPRAGRLWGGFVLVTGLASLVGAAKHGLVDGPLWAPEAARVVSNALTGAAVSLAQLAALETYVRSPGVRSLLTAAVFVQLLVFLPVLAAEALAARRGRPGAHRIAAGLGVPAAAVVLWLVQPPLGRWINHVDVEHVLMMAGLHLIFLGLETRYPRAPGRRP